MKAETYSLGVSTHGGSYAVKSDSAAVDDSNHAHVEAWADEHWVIMDATWDSNNKYENGVYNTDFTILTSHRKRFRSIISSSPAPMGS